MTQVGPIAPDDARRNNVNPLLSTRNRFKLGTFGLNGAHILTLAEDRYQADWDRSAACMRMAGDIGLDAVVSLMLWRGLELEPFTWCAALAAVDPRPALIATFHVQLNHPSFVAKAAATIDRISRGRFAINVVAGTDPRTFEAFGAALPDHASRYDQAEEHLELLRRLWTSEAPFDYEGRFYNLKCAQSLPYPLQQPFPPIMNAGTSGRGRDFAAKNADLIFTHLTEDEDKDRTIIADLKNYARETYGREVQIWTHGYCVVRDTDEEAAAFLHHYAVTHANTVAVEAWIKTLGATAGSADPAQAWKYQRHWAAGGGISLVGSAERVAKRMMTLNDIGLDGVLMNSIEPEENLRRVKEGVLPRLEASGYRAPAEGSGDVFAR